MKKLLYLVNYSSKDTRQNGISSFWRTAYEACIAQGWEFHINTNSQEIIDNNKNDTLHYHLVEIYRNPFSKEVIMGYKQLAKLLKEEKFDIIHCNTPIGGFLGRMCGKKAKVPKIIYQAHGFHFYKGAPKLNWFLYYPIEKYLARYTDALITINKEDYEIAKKKFRLRNNGKVYYVPGVGIDISKYTEVSSKHLRSSLGIGEEDVVLISAGRLDANKNNETIIKAIAKISDVKLLLCGDGELKDDLKILSDSLGISERVFFLGNRTDMLELYQIADIFIMMSLREGLSRSVMEAMASGLPCIVSDIRGNVDLIEDSVGGFFCHAKNIEDITECVKKLTYDKNMRKNMGNENIERVKRFDINNVKTQIEKIYVEDINEWKKNTVV